MRILGLLLLAGSLPAYAERVLVEFRGAPAARTGKVTAAHAETITRFRRDLHRVSIQSAEQQPRILHEYSVVFFGAAVEVDPAEVPRIRALPYVAAVHPDREVKTCSTTGEMVDAAARVNATALPTRGEGMTVGVLDTGIDYRHPDLGGGFGPGFKVAGGWDFVDNDGDPMDQHGHGTHVAGIIAANGPSLAGVAPEATLIAYKVLSASGSGAESDVIAAIERSTDPNRDGDFSDHLDVINMSLGAPGDADDHLALAADYAMESGVIVVVAAGNEGSHIASINVPGAARDAITVGAYLGEEVADFSSRGPTAGLLTFKPDVVAPGVNILSTKVGGGYIAHSGTSMAAPHAAGVCALLQKLHPEWTPADVKAALVTGAAEMAGAPFVRGAGRVDAQRAHEQKVFLRQSGLSFGLLASSTGQFEATRSFNVENRSAETQTFELSAPLLPAGVTIAITPATLAIPARESRTVEVKVSADNTAMPFAEDPQQRLIGGNVVATGTSSFAIPWAFVRSGRVKVISVESVPIALAFHGDGGHGLPARPYKFTLPTVAELYVAPGPGWEFVVASPVVSPDFESMRLLFLPNRTVTGDDTLLVVPNDAPLRMSFVARDAEGVPLAQRPRGPFTKRTMTVRWERESATAPYEMEFDFNTLTDVYVSPSGAQDSLRVVETLFDLEAMEAYSVQYEPIRGFSESKTFTRDASSMLSARFALEPVGTSLSVCRAFGDLRFVGSRFRTRGCVQRRERPEGTLRYFTTGDAEPGIMSGIQIRTDFFTTPALRVHEGAIVGAWDATPTATSMRVPNGGTASIGAGPVFPIGLPGTTGGIQITRPFPGFKGPFDEDYGLGAIATPPAPTPGSRFTFVRDGLRAAGHVSRGALEVVYGPNERELTPPSLTSLRIENSRGLNTDRLAHREAATLRFSAADFDFSKATQTQPSRPEATEAWVRVSGSASWIRLPLTIEGSETGNANDLRPVPAGDIYRADLSAATATRDALFDLRIELEDVAGNRIIWMQSPAFVVGTVAPPERRRALR